MLVSLCGVYAAKGQFPIATQRDLGSRNGAKWQISCHEQIIVIVISCWSNAQLFQSTSLSLMLAFKVRKYTSWEFLSYLFQLGSPQCDLHIQSSSHSHNQSNGVRKDSATKRALAFRKSFISEISLSTSSMNWIIKSTSLCFSISSVWALVIRNEMS